MATPLSEGAPMPTPAGGVVLELPLSSSSAGAAAAAAFDLEAAVCSHGLFMMAPNRWDPSARALRRPLRLASSPSASLPAAVSPHPTRPSLLLVSLPAAAASLPDRDRRYILEQVRRMLRVAEEDGRAVEGFHAVHGEAREKGFGRVFRSPTLFEDMVKCMLLCNCQWTRSLSMARALCELQQELKRSIGQEDFQPKTPQPRELKRKRGKKQNVRMKLETKFADDKLDCVESSETMITVYTDTAHLETKEDSHTLSSAASETRSQFDSEFSLGNASHKADPIGDFPTPEELAQLDENFLAKRCGLGYRAQRIVMLARSIVEGKVDLQRLEEMCKKPVPSTYEKLDEELSTISGFGPFTRANVLMCMGFFHKIPADTETIRHLKQCHKRASTISSVQKELDAIYSKYAPFQFLAYWFELWGFYDEQFGRISEMAPSEYGLFTASKLKKKNSSR